MPPLVLQTDLAIFLLSLVVVLETGLILLIAPREVRLRVLGIVPLANLISSVLLGPAQIQNGGNALLRSAVFVPPLFYPAKAIWDNQQYGEDLFLLYFSLILFIGIFGLLSVIIEGSILHCLVLPSHRKLWKHMAFSNAISYSLLFSWSCWISFRLSEKNSSKDFDEQLVDLAVRRLSDKGFAKAQFYSWLLLWGRGGDSPSDIHREVAC
jgi:hypothetical protein